MKATRGARPRIHEILEGLAGGPSSCAGSTKVVRRKTLSFIKPDVACPQGPELTTLSYLITPRKNVRRHAESARLGVPSYYTPSFPLSARIMAIAFPSLSWYDLRPLGGEEEVEKKYDVPRLRNLISFPLWTKA